MHNIFFSEVFTLTNTSFWAFLYVQHRHDICECHYFRLAKILIFYIVAVQNYITAIIIFLIVEMLMTWGFYGKKLLYFELKIIVNENRLFKQIWLEHRI